MNYMTMNDTKTLAPIAVKNSGILMCAPVGSFNEKILSNLLTQVFRVPCKARGVRGYHNIRNAYFDIPVNAEHGMMLVCSHEACASSGRKFRYCAVCDLPVANRNFSKRHGHGIIKPTRGCGASDDEYLPTENTLAGTKHPRKVSDDEYIQEVKVQPTTIPISPTLSPSQPVTSAVVVVSSPSTEFQTVPSTTGAMMEGQDQNTGTMTMQLSPIEFEWLALFHNRPSMEDTEAMNQWMDSVLQLSEPRTVPSVTPPSWISGNSVSR